MSVLLDTGVVSELIRKSPDPDVEAWAAGSPLENLSFSVVGEEELHYGPAILPIGGRQETLILDIDSMLRNAFDHAFRRSPAMPACIHEHRRQATFRRTPCCAGRLPARAPRSRTIGGIDAECPGLRGHGCRDRRFLGGGMSGAVGCLYSPSQSDRVRPSRREGCIIPPSIA